MIVTLHLDGRPGYNSPLLRLRRLRAGGLFGDFFGDFAARVDDAWATAGPVERWP
jgi:hypothetical protein